MTRAVALRTSAIFLAATVILAALGTGHADLVGRAALLTGLVVAGLTAAFALATPPRVPRAVPVRVRARR